MLNLNVTTEYLKLTKENVEKELEKKGYNVYDLAAYYITGFKKFNTSIKSDLRTNDNNNSLQVRVQNDRLVISDFGYIKGMSIYDYINEKYFNGVANFREILSIINNDFKLNLEGYSRKILKKKPSKHNKLIKNTNLPVKIEVKRRRDKKGNIQWSKEDITYWDSHGISIAKLEAKHIHPLDYFWITNYNKDGIRKRFDVRNELCYVYPFYRNKDGFFMYKIYLPNGLNGNKDFKWVSNVNKKVIQNIEHIPKSGDLLIIQSSYKDIICLEGLNPNIYAIAPNGEGYFFDDEDWYKLRKNWKKIIYFANNDYPKQDNPGLRFARQYVEKYNIPFISTPNNTTSDISDYYKKYGKKETNILLNKLMNYIDYIT